MSSKAIPAGNDWSMHPSINQPNRKFKNEYDLKEELGKGGFGTVKKCILKYNKKEFAVKSNNDPDKKKSMVEEAQICIALCTPHGHQNIVNIFDSIVEGFGVFNVYELATGGDIAESIIQKEYYTEREASIAFEQVLRGVEFIHSKGFIHLDLKPQNLLLQSKETQIIKITDFGLTLRRLKVPGGFKPHPNKRIGTPAYMSHEIINKDPFDIPTDMWSCGVILYQLIAGYLPFYDEKTDVDSKIKAYDYKFPSPEWDGLDAAQQLIRKLFCHHTTRLSASQALQDPFIRERMMTTTTKPRIETVKAMRRYLARRELKMAILMPIGDHKIWPLEAPTTMPLEPTSSSAPLSISG